MEYKANQDTYLQSGLYSIKWIFGGHHTMYRTQYIQWESWGFILPNKKKVE